MAFHENLRATRLAKGLTQPALAEAAQIEQSYLSKLENGRSSPSDEVLARLAAALVTPAEELMRNGESAAPAPFIERKLLIACVGVAVLAAASGWFARDLFASRPVGAQAESRVYGSLTERLHALSPAGLKLEAVAIDDDGTITVTGHMVDRESLTKYLGELRRAGIGEATLLQISDSDTRFHLRLTPFAPPAAEPGTASANALLFDEFRRLAEATASIESMARQPDGRFRLIGDAKDAAAVSRFLADLQAAGFPAGLVSMVPSDAGMRFEFLVADRHS